MTIVAIQGVKSDNTLLIMIRVMVFDLGVMVFDLRVIVFTVSIKYADSFPPSNFSYCHLCTSSSRAMIAGSSLLW